MKQKLITKMQYAKLQTKKYSPELFLGAGLLLGAATIALTVRQTYKFQEVRVEYLNTLEEINNAETLYEDSVYSDEDKIQDTKIAKTSYILRSGLAYLPVVACAAASTVCILTSMKIMKARHAALLASYLTLQESFDLYRSRVKEKYGEDVDHAMLHGFEEKTEKITVTDENGKNKKVNSTYYTLSDGTPTSMYARLFTSDHPGWSNMEDYGWMRLLGVQEWANMLLRSREAETGKGWLFLNEVYKELGEPVTPEGQIVGWVTGGKGKDGYVDMGINSSRRTYIENPDKPREKAYIVDFNVDGPIIDLI